MTFLRGLFNRLGRNSQIEPKENGAPSVHRFTMPSAFPITRKKKTRPLENDEPALNISSLIDVCFLLLIYFLVTTQIVKKEQEISSTLPVPNPVDPPAEIAPFELIIGANGHVSTRNESGVIELIESDHSIRELPNLSGRLRIYRSASLISGQKPVVKLKIEEETRQQRVTDVLNALAGERIEDITFVGF